jgi:hypothetical protein
LHTISVPISVPVTKKKKFYLNLNQYRNAHHFTLAKAKVNYHQIVEPRLSHLPRFDRIDLTYTLFTGTEQLCDVSNICSIVDKFFSDVLVSCGKIEDDNRKFVLSASYRYGGVDRTNPRVEVTITPNSESAGQQEEENMQIIIIQSEIEAAIEAQIREQIVVRDDYRIDIELRATRGEDGYQAIIDIVPVTAARKAPTADATPVTAAVKVAKASAPAAPKTPRATKAVAVEPQPEPETVEAEVASAEPDMSAEADHGEAPFDNAVDVVASPAEPVAEQVGGSAEPVPVKRPSLFGNMVTPTNN